jgi:hypothetical protein
MLGAHPIGWHILSLVLRWLSAVLVWLVIRSIWPKHNHLAAWSALIFLVYPSFHQQSSAVIYRQHWTTVIFFMLSLWAMVQSVRKEKHRYLYLALSVSTMIAQLTITEYLVGLELLRPLIFFIISDQEQLIKRLRRSLTQWLPYLLILTLFIIWRLVFVDIAVDPNPPKLLIQLWEQPLIGLQSFIQIIVIDLLHLLVSAWGDLLDPNLINFNERIRTLSWGYAFLVGILLFVTWGQKNWSHNKSSIEMFFFAAISILLGLAPAWVTGRQISVGMFSDRLSIPAMFGASLVVVCVVTYLVQNDMRRNLVLTLMVSLCIGQHLRTSNDYRWEWRRQVAFLEQLQTRIPSLKENTAFITDGSPTVYLADYNAALAANLMLSNSPQLQTWWFPHWEHYIRGPVGQQKIRTAFYNLEFNTDTENIIALRTAPMLNECIWILSSKDQFNKDIPIELREIALGLDNRFINQVQLNGSLISEIILNSNTTTSWCELYQKADLAAQWGEWDEVIAIQDQAEQANMIVNNAHGYELYPFIWANLENQDWSEAESLTTLALEKAPNTIQLYCALWEKFDAARIEACAANQ